MNAEFKYRGARALVMLHEIELSSSTSRPRMSPVFDTVTTTATVTSHRHSPRHRSVDVRSSFHHILLGGFRRASRQGPDARFYDLYCKKTGSRTRNPKNPLPHRKAPTDGARGQDFPRSARPRLVPPRSAAHNSGDLASPVVLPEP